MPVPPAPFSWKVLGPWDNCLISLSLLGLELLPLCHSVLTPSNFRVLLESFRLCSLSSIFSTKRQALQRADLECSAVLQAEDRMPAVKLLNLLYPSCPGHQLALFHHHIKLLPEVLW